ncbi:MAG: glycerol-3-phosphate 1-O-acyltransferase PlsY [Rhodocyclaceae bacterium]|nr:glycerol-3-phosphate 1-O-acyltransferase PlsY [Rhodocyclaceae bacterium]
METPLPLLVYIALGYLIGSLPFAVIVSKLFGLADPRSFGSGNPGATNVLRTGNKAAAALTLLGDASKGWIAMFVVAKLGAGGTALAGATANMETATALAGLAAFLGHVFPVFLRFKGGKGVATAIGVLIGLDGWVALGAVLVWLATAIVSRYSSLAAITAACVAPTLALAWHGLGAVSFVVGLMCLMLIWRHRGNIGRLIAGTENPIGKKKA